MKQECSLSASIEKLSQKVWSWYTYSPKPNGDKVRGHLKTLSILNKVLSFVDSKYVNNMFECFELSHSLHMQRKKKVIDQENFDQMNKIEIKKLYQIFFAQYKKVVEIDKEIYLL